MAAPIDPARLDKAIERYLAGEPYAELLSDFGISSTTLHRERKRRGIPPRRHHVLDVAPLIAAYEAGESEYSLSQRLGVSRNVVRRHLEDAGIAIRSCSAAGLVRAEQMTPDERAAQAASAHAAVRGVAHSEERLVERARTKQRAARHDSPGEELLSRYIAERGVRCVPQQAVGKYNIDLAVAPVAVEVLGGGWHSMKRSHATRTPYILDGGWHLVFVWDFEGRSALTARAADYVVAFHEEVRRNPPAVSQYRVITGGGQLLTSGSAEDDHFALEPPPRGRVNRGA